MAGQTFTPGSTCRIGKGKTVWEIIEVRSDGLVELSALGKGGYVNKTVKASDVNNVEPQRLTVNLGAVISARTAARLAAQSLNEVCRFSDAERVRRNRDNVMAKANSFANALIWHSEGLAALGIEEG